MKKVQLIFFFSLVLFAMKAQVQTKNKISWPAANPYFNAFYTPFGFGNSLLFPIKKDLTLKYNAPKLPFFCNMEEKSRNKFNIILKLRAGNDESYMKMITPAESKYPGR